MEDCYRTGSSNLSSPVQLTSTANAPGQLAGKSYCCLCVFLFVLFSLGSVLISVDICSELQTREWGQKSIFKWTRGSVGTRGLYNNQTARTGTSNFDICSSPVLQNNTNPRGPDSLTVCPQSAVGCPAQGSGRWMPEPCSAPPHPLLPPPPGDAHTQADSLRPTRCAVLSKPVGLFNFKRKA